MEQMEYHVYQGGQIVGKFLLKGDAEFFAEALSKRFTLHVEVREIPYDEDRWAFRW